MKIAFIVGEFPSISETFILSQITGLIDQNHLIDIYATQPSQKNVNIHEDVLKYDLLDKTFYFPKVSSNYLLRLIDFFLIFIRNFLIDPNLIISSLNFSKFSDPRLSRSLRLFFGVIPFLKKRPIYDVIHCHHGTNGVLGVLLRDIGAISGPLISTFHGYDINVFPKLVGENIYNELFCKAELITVNSNYTASRVLAYGCPDRKIVLLPVGLCIPKYLYRSRIIPFDEKIVIITVARLVEKKGIEFSIKAFSKVASIYPNIYYKIIGDGPLKKKLTDLVVELKLTNKVELLGSKTKEEVIELYDNSHIFVLSSVTASDGDKEGQGLVLQEAQAMGLPVIATLHNGFPDSLLNGISGFLVPEKNIDALAERLQYLIQNSQIWSDMGYAGNKFVKENFDINILNNRLIKIYEDIQFD